MEPLPPFALNTTVYLFAVQLAEMVLFPVVLVLNWLYKSVGLEKLAFLPTLIPVTFVLPSYQPLNWYPVLLGFKNVFPYKTLYVVGFAELFVPPFKL